MKIRLVFNEDTKKEIDKMSFKDLKELLEFCSQVIKYLFEKAEESALSKYTRYR